MTNASEIDKSAKRAAFTHWFGISGSQASVLWWLFEQRENCLTAGQLAVLESTTADAIMMRISRLRQAMDCEAVDYAQARGYRLTEVGIGECENAMTQFRVSLMGSAA
jgi:hypothetical protein